MRRVLLDITPLRQSRPYRHLYLGMVTSGIGAQLATTAIALQIYALTGSSFAVGLVGLYALVPIVVLGLYGGAVLDTHDRRTVALVGGIVLWVTGGLNVAQAALGNTEVGVLYALVALHSAGFAIMSPARSSIYPRLLPLEQLPAANALSVASMNIAMTVGPLLAGVIVQFSGYTTAYILDVLLFTVAMWGLSALPPIRPETKATRRAPGLSSVVDGLRFLGTRPNVRMTFLADFCAMILAQPRALFPAIAVVALAGGEATVGVLSAALAVGAVVAMMFSGPLGAVIHQGRAVVWAVVAWGVCIVLVGLAVLGSGRVFGPGAALVLACLGLAAAGAADSVSAVFRNTILQAATPDHLRGRLQGIFIVVVAGGPRLGELVSGTIASAWTEWGALLLGGLACVVAMLSLARVQRGFLTYDARDPQP
ncbi:MFS transporter [Ornithinimicrobium cryptoxanthini]|uniref:MFS transporter n=1 Tax=Ornithinimicrobium cryptoxanthini TaxID=2934161 RepID=A0ABY4YP59_9MICO|nr:MFS transporter [Ornithinimicrobium cryptoxanthini]USQ77922.1 MFS transporter [Ornithinimicrobium cryptoxanthini]